MSKFLYSNYVLYLLELCVLLLGPRHFTLIKNPGTIQRMDDTLCYLIGGAPRTGKTTLAEKLAGEHGIKPLSTDSILVMLTKIVRKEDYTNLFYTQGLTEEEFYEKYDTPDKAVQAGVKAGHDAERGITALIEQILPQWKVIVIEGAFITPGFVKRLQDKYPKTAIRATFLYDHDSQRIKERVYTKVWSHSKFHSDAARPKEVDYTKAYNEWFRHEAERYGFEITKVK